VSGSDIFNLLAATVQGAGGAAVFILVLFIGVCVLLTLAKMRPGGPKTLTVRTIEESMGEAPRYLSPDAPRGTSDQLAGSKRAA
jgi:hypothetical protein